MSASNDARPVLVTGGAGFVGSHVVDVLLDQRATVRVLTRPTTDTRFLDPARVTMVHGDVGDEARAAQDALVRATVGCDTVIHAAGITQAVRPSDYERINARGTERIARAAVESGVRRFVLISSQAAGGPAPADRSRTESDPDLPLSRYGRSKLEGERLAHETLRNTQVSLVTVRPPSVYGPRDRAFLTLFRFAERGLVPLPGGPGQVLSMIHARDLARGIALAAERSEAGRTYYLTDGVDHTAGELAGTMAQALGRKPLQFGVPFGILKAAVGLAETWSRASGRPSRLTRERLLDWTTSRWTVSDERARRELGFESAIDLPTGIAETAAWYRRAGWI